MSRRGAFCDLRDVPTVLPSFASESIATRQVHFDYSIHEYIISCIARYASSPGIAMARQVLCRSYRRLALVGHFRRDRLWCGRDPIGRMDLARLEGRDAAADRRLGCAWSAPHDDSNVLVGAISSARAGNDGERTAPHHRDSCVQARSSKKQLSRVSPPPIRATGCRSSRSTMAVTMILGATSRKRPVAIPNW
jgi:hypothetical protein